MSDRLAELKAKYAAASTANDTVVDVKDEHEKKDKKGKHKRTDSMSSAEQPEDELDEFFQLVVKVQVGLKSIEQHTEDIRAKHSEALLNTDVEHGKAISAELDRLMAEVASDSNLVKQTLKQIEEQLKQMDTKSKPAAYRIQQNQYQQLSHQFVEAMKTYSEASEQYSNKYKDQVKRRIRARFNAGDGTPLSEDQVEQLAKQLLDDNKEDAIFQQSKDTLAQIQENHRDILRIEASMRELNHIFTDMAVLIEEQGELLDDIVENVSRSVNYVSSGRAELRSARKYAKKSRKKMCCIVICLIIIAAAIVIPIYFTKGFGF